MKINTKRISLLLGVLMLATLLASCGNAENNAANNKNGNNVETAAENNQEAEDKQEAKDVKVATMEDVEKALEDDNSIVLDARSNDQFNGWALDGDKRGGHIEGATDFSAYWITGEYDEKDNLEGDSREEVLAYTMENKEITPDKTIIVYDTNDEDAKVVANYLQEKGIENVSVYNAKEWIDDDSKELVSNPNYELLLPPEKVMELTEGKEVEPIKDSKNVKIVDVRWGDEKESGYLDGHIPGAFHVNTDSFEPPKAYVDGIEEWRLTDDDSLVKLLLENGITKDSSVVVTSPEPLAATRFATICQYLGVEDVYVLNGGFVNWENKGFELATDEVKPEAADDFGGEYPANPDVITTIPELKELLNDDNFVLVDNRTWEEYIGETSGYSYHDKKGRIPGAVFGYAGKNDSSSMSYYRNIDKTIRNIDEIKAMWEEQGIDTSKKLAFMCGSGWRAAEVYWDARVMDLKDISLYSDGWIAWSNEGNPTETGEPTE